MKELMKDLKNKKGFTLVELLAVIVVLAVIILIAMPAVMSAMDKARRNALVTEMNEMAKIAQTAFADQQMNTNYSGMLHACFDIKWLKQAGYLDKKMDDYSGYVIVSLDTTDFHYDKTLKISNGIYGNEAEADPTSINASDLKTVTSVTPCNGTNYSSLTNKTVGTNGYIKFVNE